MKCMDEAFTSMLMEIVTKESFSEESHTARARTSTPRDRRPMASSATANLCMTNESEMGRCFDLLFFFFVFSPFCSNSILFFFSSLPFSHHLNLVNR